jgi:membrane protease YdiL (CAAX protease family)
MKDGVILMNTFVYKWKKNGKEYIGEKKFKNENEIVQYIESLGGELIDIIEKKEKDLPVSKENKIVQDKIEHTEPLSAINKQKNTFKVPNARNVLLVGLSYFAGQFLGSVCVGIWLGIKATAKGIDVKDPLVMMQLKKSVLVPASVIGLIVGFIFMVLSAYILFDKNLRDHVKGCAWRMGSIKQNLSALIPGLCIGFGILILIGLLTKQAPGLVGAKAASSTSIVKLASSPNMTGLIWSFMFLFIAPFAEELVFRGVLFAGFKNSLGVTRGGILVSTVFLLAHMNKIFISFPAFIGIFILAAGTLFYRIRFKAIGPSIVFHMSYNFFISIPLLATFAR